MSGFPDLAQPEQVTLDSLARSLEEARGERDFFRRDRDLCVEQHAATLQRERELREALRRIADGTKDPVAQKLADTALGRGD